APDGRRELSAAAVEPELPRSAVAAGRRREPHLGRPARLQRGGAGLQHKPAHLPDGDLGQNASRGFGADAAVRRHGGGADGADGGLRLPEPGRARGRKPARLRRTRLRSADRRARPVSRAAPAGPAGRVAAVVAILLCLLWLAATPAAAQGGPRFPALSGRVVDQAGLLSPAREAEIATRLEALERDTT